MNATNVRSLVLTGFAVAAVIGLSGCVRHHHWRHDHNGRALIVPARLDCPEDQGALTRVSIAADGTTCEYRRDDGEQVSLIRLPLNGQTPQAALAPTEAVLKTLLPQHNDAGPAPKDDSHPDNGDTAKIDVPGVHIDAHGDKAEVRVFGVTIDADNNRAHVNAGLGGDHALVSADEHGAEVRAVDDRGVNANLVLVLATEHPGPTGLYTAGYIARGPSAGPLVVAEFKSPHRESHGAGDHDIRRLIDRNLSH